MEIRRIQDKDIEAYGRLQLRAYPSIKFSSEADWTFYLERTKKMLDNPEYTLYGCFQEDALLGSLILYHYQINYLGTWLPIKGIGSVAVDLLHKREQICRKMMVWAEEETKKESVSLAFLFPFRPDFYVPMGYGYGPMLFQYTLDPGALPSQGEKSKLIYLGKEDLPLIRDFENTMDASFHGYVKKQDREIEDYFHRISFQKIGYFEQNKLEGWMVFNTQIPDPRNFLRSHLYIYEWWNKTLASKQAFLSFLHSQKDQYEQIIYSTVDSSLMHLAKDPRSDKQKMLPPFISHPVGQMSTSIFYSVIQPQKIFELLLRHKGLEKHAPFHWEITRPLPETHLEVVEWPFEGVDSRNSVCIRTNQAIASSLMMGSLSLRQAVSWKLAEVTPVEQLEELDKALSLPIPHGTPNC
jgi:hypothetical protein